jgi:hypothetical protein
MPRSIGARGRFDGTPADDDPGRGSDCLEGNYVTGAGRGGLSDRARLRGLVGLTPLQKSTGGKQKFGVVSKRGERTIRPPYPRRECRGSPSQPARGASGLVAGADADTQAEDVGHRSPCQQDGPRRVGSAGQRRRLQNSGRGGVGWSRPRGVGRAEGKYGATVGETGLGKPGLSTVLRARHG